LFGGLSFYVDDEKIDISKKIVYNGMFVTDIPNMAYAVGYTNASWTLKVDLSSSYLCRLMNHMRASGYKQVTIISFSDVLSIQVVGFFAVYRAMRRSLDRAFADAEPDIELHQARRTDTSETSTTSCCELRICVTLKLLQGSRRPFRYWHNYFMDLLSLRYSNLDTDTVLEFK
jgi:hypothetical protein